MYGLEIGQFVVEKRTFTEADVQEYIALTKDNNPMYSDDMVAKKNAFDGCIVPKPLIAGMFSHILGVRLPGRGTGWLKQKLHYPDVAYPGEEITAKVEIIRLRPEKEIVNLKTTCTNPNGKIVCDGESLVLVKNLEAKKNYVKST